MHAYTGSDDILQQRNEKRDSLQPGDGASLHCFLHARQTALLNVIDGEEEDGIFRTL